MSPQVNSNFCMTVKLILVDIFSLSLCTPFRKKYFWYILSRKILFTAFYISAWLMATVNVGEVQPKGEVTHLSDSDREPFFQSQTGAESFTSQDTMYSSASSPVQATGAQPNYGATDH
jgi:hypothetical protein